MSLWRNLKIGVKVYSGFAAVLAILIALGFFSLWNLGVINDQSTEIAKNWLPSVVSIETMNTLAGDFRSAQSTHLVASSDADMAKAESDMARVADTMAATAKQYETLISSDDKRAMYQEFAKDWAQYIETGEQLLALSKSNDDKGAAAREVDAFLRTVRA